MQTPEHRIQAACFFFTLRLADRSATTLVDHIGLLRTALRRVKLSDPFEIVAMVVLPDHLHAVWRLPPRDQDYRRRWALIKRTFAEALNPGQSVQLSRRLCRTPVIWQQCPWQQPIEGVDQLRQRIAYVHANPVKHGYVAHPEDWPYSSVHRQGAASSPHD
ncbi:MAG: transposase [Pseudomonas sp.]|uniref:REP-associated tyrosine transposase n=1 Tax=Pseudomonas sp. TaxID=306 RepID=UPI003395F6D4